MGLDVRLPIGAMFAVIGALLAVYGVVTSGDEQVYLRSLSVNINLWWGVAMLIFGLVMLMLGWRGATEGDEQGVHPAEQSPEGRATEAREHRLGLERER
jgi:hypothetical protein